MVKELLAGVSKQAIPIDESMLPIDDFVAIHDPLHVRVLYLNQIQPFLLISIEVTSLPDSFVEKVKKRLSDTYEIGEENIWICVTHTFSAPHIRSRNQMFQDKIEDTIVASAAQAYHDCCEVELCFNQADTEVNVNRNSETSAGWWLGKNEQEYTNHTVRLLTIKEKDTNHILVVLFNLDIQPAVMCNSQLEMGGRAITGDLVGYTASLLEEKAVDTAIFLPGAAGDQRPVYQACEDVICDEQKMRMDQHEAGFDPMEQLGKSLATCIFNQLEQQSDSFITDKLQLFSKTFFLDEKKMPIATKDLKPVRNFEFTTTGSKIAVTVVGLKLGDLLVLGTQPELNSSYGKRLMDITPCQNNMLVTLVNGGRKYLPEEKDYERITYMAMNSPFALGASETLLQELSIFLQRDLF